MRILIGMATLLVAGCVGLDVGSPAGGDDPGPGQAVDREPALPGVELSGEITTEGRNHTVDAVLGNDGKRTYWIWTMCGAPWTKTDLYDDQGKRVMWREPFGTCAGHAHTAFAPGDDYPFQATWDERVWNKERQEMVDAPAGTYVFNVTAWPIGTDEQFDDPLYALAIMFEVRVE